MMQFVLDSAYPVAAQCDRPSQQPRLARHFTRGKARKRAILLCKQGRPIAALSLLYAHLTANSRVRQFRVWSQARVQIAPIASAAGASPEQLHSDILKMHKAVTADVAGDVRDDVFRMVVQRYCRKECTTRQLVDLRRSLGSQCGAATAPIWHMVSSTLDTELAKRELVGHLKNICALLQQPADDARALERGFIQLAVALQRIDDQSVGHRSLVRALHHMTDSETWTLARQVFEGATLNGIPGGARLANVLASAPAAGLHGQAVRRDLTDRRAALTGLLQDALRQHMEGRLEYFERATAQLIRNCVDKGQGAQAAYQAGAASLEKILGSLRYREISDEFAPERLLPRLMPRILAANEAAVTVEFLSALDDATFAHVRNELSAGRGGAAWPALSTACGNKLSRYRDDLSKALYELQARAAMGDRGAASIQVVKVAQSFAALCERMERLGLAPDADERAKIEQRLGRACQVFRHPGNPKGVLDHTSVAALSDDEVRNLRIASRCLEPFGLFLSEPALQAEAMLRSAHHRDAGIRALGTFLSAVAVSPTDIDSAVHALRDAVGSGTAALQTMLAFMDVGAEELASMTDDWAKHAIAKVDPALFAAPETAMSTCEALRQGFSVMLDALLDISSKASAPDAPDIVPVRNISDMMVLARYLVASLQAELNDSPVLEHAIPIGESGVAPAWSPALRSAIASAFGVDYAPRSDLESQARSSFVAGSDSGFGSNAELDVHSYVDSDSDADDDTGVATLLLPPHQYQHLLRALADPIHLDPNHTEWVETSFGGMRLGRQFLRDFKRGLTLSVSGVSADGHRVPRTTATYGKGDPLIAFQPVLGALHRLVGERKRPAAGIAGPVEDRTAPSEPADEHTGRPESADERTESGPMAQPGTADWRMAAILEYVTQTALAGWFKMTVDAGSDGPYKLSGGRATPVGGGATIDADVARGADGRYFLHMKAKVAPSENIMVCLPGGGLEGIPVDPDRTYYAIDYGIALSFDDSGGHTVEVVAPPVLRYRVTERGRPESKRALVRAWDGLE
jgi:hypothetical protein